MRFPIPLLFVLLLIPVLSPPCSIGDENAYAAWENGPRKDADYFPIAVWLQSPNNAAKFKEAGFNLYVGLWNGPTDEQLAELTQAGMPVICDQNQVGLKHIDDPIIVAWMHGDEPDNAQPITDPQTGRQSYGPCIPPEKIVKNYEAIRKANPSRPVMLNLGQGVANDNWIGRGSGAHIDDYLTYVKGCDVVSFDVYPMAGLKDGINLLWCVAKGVDRLIQWSEGKKIVWNCLECTRIGDEFSQASPQQLRSEAWMSIIHGSMGLIYFVHQFKPAFKEAALLDDPEMLAAATALNKQIQSLAPVLNSPTLKNAVMVKSSDDNVPIDILAKRHDKNLYLFAVGMRNAPAKAEFQLSSDFAGAKAEVLGENRDAIPLTGRHFADSFEPYGVHIYRIALP